MATNRKVAATITFFKADDGTSDSDDSDVDELNPSSNQGTAEKSPPASPGNPFLSEDEGSDDEDYRDREESIYDSHTSSDIAFSRSTRRRTDSDSNYLQVEDNSTVECLILNITDDHFGQPGDLSRLRDVNQEIDKIKQMIYTTPDENPEKTQLIEKLISLRLRKSELENPDSEESGDNTKTIYGHRFRQKESTAETERCCEVCSAVVWGVLQTWYTCILCHVCCHDKCLNALKRMCASKKITESSTYLTSICKDRGLAAQNYKCFECQVPISYKQGGEEPRQCDYTGNYYCSLCHWNDEIIIPARVLHNWDFVPRKVCRASKQYLKLMYLRPVLCVEHSNKYLMNFVEELGEMKKLRQELLLMKVYFLSCQSAMQSKILRQLEKRQHFVENADYYTMNDIVELVNERLLPTVVNIHASFASHIKVECATCRGKGYYCEICQKSEVLFPFDNICVLCPECSNVFHKYCFAKANQVCPRCERRRRRQEENERKAQLLRQIEEANST